MLFQITTNTKPLIKYLEKLRTFQPQIDLPSSYKKMCNSIENH